MGTDVRDTDVLARLLDTVPVAVVVADLRGRVVLVSEAGQRLLGYGPREIQAGLRVADLYHHREDARTVADRLRGRLAGTVAIDEPIQVELRASNGDLIRARLTVSFLRNRAGVLVGTLGVFQDRREEDGLLARLADVTNQVEIVERRAAGIQVAAAASHELAQPLTAALGQMEMLLLESGLSDAATERAGRVVDLLDRMRRIVLEFTRTVTAQSLSRTEKDR